MGEKEAGKEFDYRIFLEEEFQKRQRNGEMGVITGSESGIPVLFSRGQSLARAWENSLICLYARGSQARTQYDAQDKKTGEYLDPPSVDCSMAMVVQDPSSEPLIHRAFPGGLGDLEEYRQEVLDGIKNHWVRVPTNPGDKRWEYTYNERITEYAVPLSKVLEVVAQLPDAAKEIMRKDGVRVLLDQPWVKVVNRPIYSFKLNDDGNPRLDEQGRPEIESVREEPVVVINQLEACIDGLAKSPHTRRVQIITWKPWEDLVAFDPACLQSFWFRILPDADGRPRLNTNERFRSRDAYDAAYMNCFAFVHLIEKVAKGVSEKRGEEILVGRYVDESDSYHIYGKRRQHFEQGFLRQVRDRSFEDRTWTREFAEPIFEEERPMIARKAADKNAEYGAGKLTK